MGEKYTHIRLNKSIHVLFSLLLLSFVEYTLSFEYTTSQNRCYFSYSSSDCVYVNVPTPWMHSHTHRERKTVHVLIIGHQMPRELLCCVALDLSIYGAKLGSREEKFSLIDDSVCMKRSSSGCCTVWCSIVWCSVCRVLWRVSLLKFYIAKDRDESKRSRLCCNQLLEKHQKIHIKWS